MEKVSIFFKGVVEEFKKVEWPARAKVIDNTKLVLISTVFFALFFLVVDLGAAQAINFILGL